MGKPNFRANSKKNQEFQHRVTQLYLKGYDIDTIIREVQLERDRVISLITTGLTKYSSKHHSSKRLRFKPR